MLINGTRNFGTLRHLINLQKVYIFSDLNVYNRLVFLYAKGHFDNGLVTTPLPYRTNTFSEDNITG
jgi:hypothetical protein